MEPVPAAHNAAQYTAEMASKAPYQGSGENDNTPVLLGFTESYSSVHNIVHYPQPDSNRCMQTENLPS